MYPSDKSNICSTHLVAHTARCTGGDAEALEYICVDGLNVLRVVHGQSFSAKNESFTMKNAHRNLCPLEQLNMETGQPLCCLSHWYSSQLRLPCTYNSHHRLLSAKADNGTLEQVDSFSLASTRVHTRVHICSNICTRASSVQKKAWGVPQQHNEDSLK